MARARESKSHIARIKEESRPGPDCGLGFRVLGLGFRVLGFGALTVYWSKVMIRSQKEHNEKLRLVPPLRYVALVAHAQDLHVGCICAP